MNFSTGTMEVPMTAMAATWAGLRPKAHSRDTRGSLLARATQDLRPISLQTPTLRYHGAAQYLNDVVSLHWQVEPHPIDLKMKGNGCFAEYHGDARHFHHAQRAWREHRDEIAAMRAWKSEHPIGKRVLRFFKETVELLRELF